MRPFIRLNLLLFSLSFFLIIGSSFGIAANLDVCRNGCPYQTIQAAIEVAEDGDLIRIAASPDAYDGSLNLNGEKNLTIEGGWDDLQTGTSTSIPGSTVIQGNGDTPVIDISTSGNSTLTFRNLTVSGGGNGIEVWPESGSLALGLEQIVVKDNESAGIWVSSSYDHSQITIDASNLWITNNRGGVYLFMGQESPAYSQEGMMPMQEGPVYRTDFTNCTITNNNEGVGGVVLEGEANVTFTNCIVWDNNATYGDYNEPSPRDIYLPYSYYSIHLVLDHCDLGELVNYNENATVNSTTILDVDPLLQEDDFHLSPDSPCIDSGTAVDSPLTDIEGQPRPRGYQFDIGADEVPGCEFDEQGPGTVQYLTALFSSGSIILNWHNPPDPDLDGLLLYRLGPGDTEPQMVQQLDKTTETATIDDIVLPGLYTFSLVPIDLCDNKGNETKIKITVHEEDYCEFDEQGPGMVQYLTALFSSGSIILNWENPPDQDLNDLLLLYRLDSDDTESQMVQVLDKTTETATIDDNITWGDYTFTLVPRDLCGNLGEQAEVEITVTVDQYCEFDEQGPGMVQDLTARFSSGSIILDWHNPPDRDFDGLLLYRFGPGDSEPLMVQSLDKTTETATIDDVIPWGHYTLTLVPIDMCGNLGEQAEVQITVTGVPIACLPFLATSEGWTTEILIANASEKVANVHLDLFSDGLVSHFEDHTIPQNGILQIPINQGDAGILQSTDSIVALIHISGNEGSAWYPASIVPEAELYIPYIEADQHWRTGLTLFNPLEFTNHITLRLDNDFDIPLTLPPHGQISLDLCNFIENSGIACNNIRTGHLISTDGAAFVGVSSISARNWPGADMAIMLLSGDSANVLDVPYIGDNRYTWTGITVLQTQRMFRSILVQPFSSTGPAAGVEFISSNPEGQNQVALNLSAWLDGSKVKWAEVSSPQLVDENFLTGSIFYGTRSGFDLVNALKLRFRDAVIPVLGDNTSLCLLNPHETPTGFAYTTFDEHGNTLVSDTMVLNPYTMQMINLNRDFGQYVTHLKISASDTLVGVLQGSEGNSVNRSPVLSVPGGSGENTQ
ncbi:MAG: hypothetical protein C4B58_10585 [Deltaproteobacteria bacterium]|nr:MAG: hypothetical protein C4B58_10585 [Deltaproteobacteria bacterium]